MRAVPTRGTGVERPAGSGGFVVDDEPPTAQVGRGLAQLLSARGGTTVLRLRPDHLGEVRAHLELKNGDVSVSFVAENERARELLDKSADTLRSMLEAKGLRVTEIRIEGPAEPGRATNGQGEAPGERQDGDRSGSGDERAGGSGGDQPSGARRRHESSGERTDALPATSMVGPLSGAPGVYAAARGEGGAWVRLDAIA